MEIFIGIFISIIAISITIIGGLIRYYIRMESRIKDLENNIRKLEPFIQVITDKGKEHVIGLFERRNQ